MRNGKAHVFALDSSQSLDTTIFTMKFTASALLLLADIPSVAAGARGARKKNDIPDEEQTNRRALLPPAGKGSTDVSIIALYTLFLMLCIIQIPQIP
jgi:hypothetical protein